MFIRSPEVWLVAIAIRTCLTSLMPSCIATSNTASPITSLSPQGHDEPFLEQWHQKLHQNTTPEDVTICEAYLAYLHSGELERGGRYQPACNGGTVYTVATDCLLGHCVCCKMWW